MAHLKSVLTFPPASAEERSAAMLASQYTAVRQQTESLTAPLSAEDQMVQSCADASPAKWHQAHTTWFFETFILSQHLPGYRGFDTRFRDLFNSYYNAVGQQPDKALRNTFSRPSLE
ncbi:MAG TPA: ergothioneine biosynthesis protein EgtB, partial [Candidatus Angelobacter sp.]|nr:ergothioneine biosynthesis protein EgtB [Candidatus Angelobacter sp.]